jgi:beta-N-acetylhexosaminidase
LRKSGLFSAILLIIAVLFYGCGPVNDSGSSTGTTAPETTISVREPEETEKTAREPDDEEKDTVRLRMAAMSLDEKIGQVLFFGFEGVALDPQAIEIIERYKPGGLIVMGGNVKSVPQLLELVNSLKAEASKNGIPAFISVDEEGGRVNRMPPELKNLPPARKIGKTGSADIADSVGGLIADELRAFGFNMDFAPVLDIWSNPENTVIGDRALGTDAETVGRLGVRIMKGIASGGVIPVVKHFPGHGDTAADSHKELPVSDRSLKSLEDLELKPFEEAIANGADAVMVAHILLPQLDANYPSSLSKALITDILRNQMKFDGLVVTDDMTMGAISKNYGLAEAAVTSFQAGSDMILVVNCYDDEIAVAEALKDAVGSGKITQERLDESVYRILKLKEKYGLENAPVGAVDVAKLNSRIEKINGNINAG